jgi:hypothetical protein
VRKSPPSIGCGWKGIAMAADETIDRALTEEERRWRADVLEQLHRLNLGLELLNRTSEQLADVVARAPWSPR